MKATLIFILFIPILIPAQAPGLKAVIGIKAFLPTFLPWKKSRGGENRNRRTINQY